MFIKKFKSVIALLLLPTLICSSLHLPVLAASTEDFIGIDSMSEPEYSIDISEFTEVIEEDWPELVIWGDSEDDFIGLNTNLVPEDSIDISEFTEVSEEDLLELIIWGNTGDGTIEEPEYSVDFSELEEVYESIVPTSTTMYVWDRFNIQYIQGTWTAYTAWSGTNQTATGRTGISFGASTGLVYSGNTITLSRTNTNGGNPVYTGTATSGTRIEINSSGQKRTRSITATQSRGTLVGTVSSASSTAYPTNGAQGGFWYANRRVVTLPMLTISRGTVTSATVHLTGTITNNGGATITEREFWIRRQSGNTTLRRVPVNTTSNTFSQTIPGLDPNTTYIARAVASNGVTTGHGQSAEIIFTTPPNITVPTAPLNFGATRGDRQVSLSWSAPSSNGGAAITSYQVSSNGGSSWVPLASSARSYTFTGLTNGTSYAFRVRAVNSAGDGAQASVSATPVGYPNLTVSRGTLTSTTVVLNGTITNNGGAAITNRGFFIRPTNGALAEHWIGGTANSFSHTITNLQPNTEYIARAVAKNSSGLEGAGQSEQIIFRTPAAPPTAPRDFRATLGDRQVRLNWSAPSSNGGATIQRYEVSRNNGSTWETASSNTGHTLTGLTAGTSYTFRVRAVNSAGDGTQAWVTVTAAGYPNLTVSRGTLSSTSVILYGTITNNGGYAIIDRGFWIRPSNGTLVERWIGGSASSFNMLIEGLQPNTEYIARAVAKNDSDLEGAGQSSEIRFTTPKGSQAAPAAPTVSSVTANSVTLVSVSGCEYSRNGTSWQASTTFSGLSAGTTYNFYQRRAETATLNASPSSPARQATTLSTTTYTITRTAPTNGSFSAPSTGTAGSTITISSITPNNGFSVGTITVRRHDTQATIPVSGTGTSRTFTMPASNVTVTIAFTSTGGGTPVNCPPLAYILRGTAAQYLSMGIGWPLGNEDDTERRSFNRISSAFGPRSSGLHLGFDMNRLNDNTPIDGIPLLAVTGGVVVDVNRDSSKGQGYSISIRSDTLRDPATSNLLIFTYMHMRDAPTLKIDDTVSKGQRIGRVGNTGTSTGPHLHFEVSNSGSVWGPGSDSWDRVTRRINPLFFYPAGSFVDNTNIWDEVRGVQPRSIDTELDFGEYEVGRFRPIFYNLPATFAELVGRDACRTWELSRTPEEIETENIAVGFVKYFSISKEDFTAANEQLRQNWVIREPSPQASSAEEIYPVDLIFTFDNESINRFFLWKNSSIPEERMLGQSDSSITSITIPDLSYNGTFSFNTIKLLTEGLTFDTVFVEINKYNALNTDPAKVSNTIGINAHGVGIYSPVPSSVHIDTKDGYIEIVVYEDDTRQKLFTRHIIRPALFEF